MAFIFLKVKSINNDAIIQTRNYMNSHSMNCGMIINFGQSKTGLQLVFVQNDDIYDFTNKTFVKRNVLTI